MEIFLKYLFKRVAVGEMHIFVCNCEKKMDVVCN